MDSTYYRMLWIPDFLQDVEGLYTGWNLWLWYSAIVIQLLISVLLFLKGRKITDIESLRWLIFSYAFFFLAMSVNRFFFIFSYITEYYNLGLSIGYVACTVALIPVILTLEKFIMPKTHFFFTILCFIMVALSIFPFFLPDNLVDIRNTLQLIGLGTSVIWFFLYFWMVKITTGAPRQKAIMTIVALVIALAGFFFDSERVLAMKIFPVIVAPILYIAGVILMGYLFLKKD